MNIFRAEFLIIFLCVVSIVYAADQNDMPVDLIKRLDTAMEKIQSRKNLSYTLDMPVSKEELKIAEIKLTGILWHTKEPLAIINNKIFAVGEKIEDYELVDIREKNVVFRNIAGEERIIPLYEKTEFDEEAIR